MSFTLRLSSDVLSVEAGATVPLSIEVANRSEEADRYEIEIEGLDPEWTAVPVPAFGVGSLEEQSEKVFFKPPRVSESLSGDYPFVVKVRSLSSGESRTVQGVLQIKPYHHLSMELSPKRGSITPFRKQTEFQAALMNLGNTEHTLQLVGNDVDDACAFEFEQEQVTLAPGQQRTVSVVLSSTSNRVLASSRLFGFTIVARSIESSSVMCSAQAQLEQRPLLSPLGAIFFVFVATLIALWVLLLPKAPSVDSLTLDRPSVLTGEPVTIRWSASNAKYVRISVAGTALIDHGSLAGQTVYTPTAPGTVLVEAVALRDNRQSAPVSAELQVGEPAVVPDPEILTFKTSASTVNLGEPFVIEYKVSPSVVKAYLAPTGEELNLKVGSRELIATLPGEREYTLVAENANGKTARKSLKLNVVEASQAKFVVFDVDPKVVDPAVGRVTVTWQFSNAVRAELSDGTQKMVVEASEGRRDYLIDKETTFTLTGYDAQGLTTTRSITVKMLEPPPPDTGSVSTTGGTGGTGSTTGGRL
ncbi:MAG: hypothetical protein M9921_04825 [Fimbriimonadaceae bacterium]|nr:hypothetical protein [Chthonomonadaceae bacterium]MCO5296161.1 hypothetical protein [Fimbriimonadaceae bacterium]